MSAIEIPRYSGTRMNVPYTPPPLPPFPMAGLEPASRSSQPYAEHVGDPLVPFEGDEDAFEVDNNGVASSPGRLEKPCNPNNVEAHKDVGGLDLTLDNYLEWRRTVEKVVADVVSVHIEANKDRRAAEVHRAQRSSSIIGHIKQSQDSKNGHLRVFEVPCSVSGRYENGLADAAAKMNFMKESVAKGTPGIIIDHQKTDSVRLGSGKLTRTTGTAYASFKFKDEDVVHHLSFGLLPSCMHNIILGMPFLKASRTLSDISNRLRRIVERTRRMLTPKQYEFLYLGSQGGPKFEGFINDEPCEGLGDTGAKVGVMTESEAWYQELTISRGDEDRCTLVMGDGSTVRTIGTAYKVPWRFGRDDEKSESYTLDFHIVKEAPHHIILPESLLYDSNAFCDFEEYLTDEDAEETEGAECHFLMIDVAMQAQILAGRTFEDIRHDELVRQGQEEDRIDSLPVSERAVAWQQELGFRELWKSSFEKQKRWHEAHTHGTATVQVPAMLSHGAQPVAGGGLGKRRFWFLHRKRTQQTGAQGGLPAASLLPASSVSPSGVP